MFNLINKSIYKMNYINFRTFKYLYCAAGMTYTANQFYNKRFPTSYDPFIRFTETVMIAFFSPFYDSIFMVNDMVNAKNNNE